MIVEVSNITSEIISKKYFTIFQHIFLQKKMVSFFVHSLQSLHSFINTIELFKKTISFFEKYTITI